MSGGTPSTFDVRLTAIRNTASVPDLRMETLAAFRLLGFSKIFYLSPVIRNRDAGRRFVNQGFPEEFERAYPADLKAIDPYPDYACTTGKPVRWSDPGLETNALADRKQFLSALAPMGISDGIGIPVYGLGARIGYIGLSGPVAPMTFDAASLPLLQAVGAISYLKYCESLITGTEAPPALSRQELAVLLWMAQGKSNSDIGVELGLALHTVNTYVRRIFAKLGVTDRTSAVLRGVARGFILASDIVIDAAIDRRAQIEDGGAA